MSSSESDCENSSESDCECEKNGRCHCCENSLCEDLLCDEHSNYAICSINNGCNSNKYCERCFKEGNGLICQLCNSGVCHSHLEEADFKYDICLNCFDAKFEEEYTKVMTKIYKSCSQLQKNEIKMIFEAMYQYQYRNPHLYKYDSDDFEKTINDCLIKCSYAIKNRRKLEQVIPIPTVKFGYKFSQYHLHRN